MNKAIFEEEQRIKPLWIILISLPLVLILFFSGGKKENPSMSDYLIPAITFILISVLLMLIKLKTRIDEEGIHVQFFPFHLSTKTFPWNDIYSAQATTYNPIGDYGGWGYRVSFRKKGKAFTISGNLGIKIVTGDGKIRMIGTKKADEANRIIQQFHSIPTT